MATTRAPKKTYSTQSKSKGAKLSSVSYVILYTNAMNKSVSFYRDTLGMKIKAESPFWSEIDAGGFTLALHACEKAPVIPSDTVPEVVFGVKNFQSSYENLASQGVKFLGKPHEVCSDGKRSGVSANFRDPSGNHLSIFGWVKALQQHVHGENCSH